MNNYQGLPTSQILLSFAIGFYQSLVLVSLLDVIQCLHKADECKFLLVSQ